VAHLITLIIYIFINYICSHR